MVTPLTAAINILTASWLINLAMTDLQVGGLPGKEFSECVDRRLYRA